MTDGKVGTFSTVADVQNSHIPPVLESIRTHGHASPGDGGGALYVEGGEGPGAIQSADGRWWVPVYLTSSDRIANDSTFDGASVTAALESAKAEIGSSVSEVLQPTKARVLLHGDYQPTTNEDVALLTTILEQTAEDHPDIDWMIMAGDVIDENMQSNVIDFGPPEMSELLVQKLPVNYYDMYALPGNHDINYSGNLGRTQRYLNEPHSFETIFPTSRYWTLRGTILTVFLPDRTSGPAAIAKEDVEWAKELVRAHQHCFVIIVSHQHPRSFQDGAEAKLLEIIDPDNGRRVDLWIYAHETNAPNGTLDPNFTTEQKANGCWFVNVGIHVSTKKNYPNLTMSYCLMELEHGSRTVRVRRWDVENREWVPSKSIEFEVPHPVLLARQNYHDGRFARNDRFDVSPYPIRSLIKSPQTYDGTDWVPADRFMVARWSVYDVGTNIYAGQQFGIAVDIPIEREVDGVGMPWQNYQCGFEIVAERNYQADDAKGANVVIYAGAIEGGSNAEGEGLMSRVEVFRGNLNGRPYFVNHNTSSNPANARLDETTGQLLRSTSALKYKTDIEDIPQSMLDKALTIRGITYRSLCEGDDPDQQHVGIIADEAHAAGLTQLVDYNSEGEPEYFAYERMTAILLELVKRLDARVTALEQSTDA